MTPPSFSCRIKSLFYRSSNLQYFKRLIQIPQLPEVRIQPDWPQLFTGLSAAFFSDVLNGASDIRCFCLLQNPPNFLRASALSEHISPVVVIPAESSSPESEHAVETDDLVDTDVPAFQVTRPDGTRPLL